MQIKEEIKKLWKLCFDDNDEFVEMYFRLRYNGKTTMYIQSGNMIISSLQMPFYTLIFGGTEIRTAYISGACTHPEFRGKGVMGHLLAESFSRMVQKNIPLSILIPANPGLYGYYARAGYAQAFFHSRIEQNASDIIAGRGNLHFEHTTVFEQRVFNYFARKAHNRPNYVQHTADEFKAVMEDLRISEGSVTIARKGKDGPVGGVLFAYPEGHYLKIADWFADNDGILNNLLREAARYHQQPRIVRFDPPAHAADETPFGMARIINAMDMLQIYAAEHPEIQMAIKLTDRQLTFNDGYYYIDKGTCIFSKEPLKDEAVEMSAQELSALLFDSNRLYMSLMLE